MSQDFSKTTGSSASLQERRLAIIRQHGEWTAHNIELGDQLYTISAQPRPEKLVRTLQVVADLIGKPLDQIRVLDLGCLEGLYAIEFARHGAEVVGIEGREASLAKANFAKDALGLTKLTFFQDDIRNLSPEKYGYFDVVLCIGVFYHLDADSAFRLTAQMQSVCRRMMFMDTYIGMTDRSSYQHNGHTYWGVTIQEHQSKAGQEEKQADLWASLDNVTSVWLTRPSLLNLLAHVGFTSVYECHNPSEPGKPADRIALVALKGDPQKVLVAANANSNDFKDWPEHSPANLNPKQKQHYELSKKLTHLVPTPIRTGLKRLLRSAGLIKSSDKPWDWERPFEKRDGSSQDKK